MRPVRSTPRTPTPELRAARPVRSRPQADADQVLAWAKAARAGDQDALEQLVTELAVEREGGRGWQRWSALVLAELVRERAWADLLDALAEWDEEP